MANGTYQDDPRFAQLRGWAGEFASNFPSPISKPLVSVPSSGGSVPILTRPATPTEGRTPWNVDKAVANANTLIQANTPRTTTPGMPYGAGLTNVPGGAPEYPSLMVPGGMEPPTGKVTPYPMGAAASTLPENLAGYKGTVTDAMMKEYMDRIGYTPPAVPTTPERPYTWADYDLGQASLRRTENIGELGRDVGTARMAEAQHAVDVEKWTRQPSLYASELRMERAGKYVPTLALATAVYEGALRAGEVAGIERAKLPYETGRAEAETAEARAKTAMLPGGTQYATGLAGELQKTIAAHVPPDRAGNLLTGLGHIINTYTVTDYDTFGNKTGTHVDHEALKKDPNYQKIFNITMQHLMKGTTSAAVPQAGNIPGQPSPTTAPTVAPSPITKPSWDQFYQQAKPMNLNASDAELQNYYYSTYGG